MRDARHGERGDQVATNGRTDERTNGRTDVPTTSGGRAAFRASAVVVAYVEARGRAGLSTDPRSRAILGKYARLLIATGDWRPETLLEAAERFAISRRHPRFFAEWVATVVNQRSEAEHLARKADEASVDPFANLNAQLAAAGLPPIASRSTRATA